MVYASKAFELADVIVRSQQRQPTDWSVPLTGFFYTDPSRNLILHYSHRGHDQGPIMALAGLCEAYWYPLYAFIRRSGAKPEDAEDLTQASSRGFWKRTRSRPPIQRQRWPP